MGAYDDILGDAGPQKTAAAGGAYDDLFDGPAVAKSGIARRALGDTAVSALKGAISVPEAVVGLADMATGGYAGKAAEGIGFRPKESKAILDDLYSPEQKAANKTVHGADGFLETVKAGVQNPSVIGHSVVESLPLLLPGAVAARGLTAAGKVAPWAAGAIGEGVVGAGSAAESIRQQTDDGLLSAKQAGAALASGVGTAAFGAAGGKAAQKLGIGDLDTMLAGGATSATNKGITRRVAEGAVSEGVLEELPQSMWEQASQNVAMDKPIGEGVGQAGALGMLAGGAMGAGFNAMPASRAQDTTNTPAVPPTVPPQLPDTGPLSRSANVALASGAANPANLAPAIEPINTTADPLQRITELELLAEQRPRTQAENVEFDQLQAAIEQGDAEGANDLLQAPEQQTQEAATEPVAAVPASAPQEVVAQPDAIVDPAIAAKTDKQLKNMSGAGHSKSTRQAASAEIARRAADIAKQGVDQGAAKVPQTIATTTPEALTAAPEIPNGDGVTDQPTDTGIPMSVANEQQAGAGLPAPTAGGSRPTPVADLSGDKLSNEWTAFSNDSGSLNIPRANMPQIKAEHRGAMTQFMSARGVTHAKEDVPADSLRPTQAEFSPAKVKKAIGFDGGDRSILVSADNYVLDGHHQWLAKRETGSPVSVMRLNAPIATLIDLAHEFPSSTVAKGSTASTATQEPIKNAVPSAATVPAESVAPKQMPIKNQSPDAGNMVPAVDTVSQPKIDAAPEAKPKTSRKKIDATKDTLFQAIAKLGGMDTQELISNGIDKNDITHESTAKVSKKTGKLGTKPRRPISFGFNMSLHKQGGMSFDGMLEALKQYGYFDQGATKNDAIEAFTRELGGEAVLTPDATMRNAEEGQAAYDAEMLAEQEANGASGYDDIDSDRERALVDFYAESVYDDEDPRAAFIRGLRKEGLSDAEVAEEVSRAFGAAEAGSNDLSETPEGTGIDRAAQGRDDGGQDGSAQEGVAPDWLTGQTNEEAAEQFAQQQAGESAEPTKEQADRERDAVPFAMQQQSQPKPQGVQTGLFTADGRVSSEAKPSASAVDAKIDVDSDFVKSPDGSIDFGEITSTMASTMRRQTGKIRLEKGDGSYGLQHIEERHGAQIRGLGFDSVESFVADAAGRIESIWTPKKSSQMVMVQSTEKGKAVFVELKPSESGDFYTVNTAFPVGKHYAANKGWKLLWGGASVPTEASGANPLAEQSPNAGATVAMTPGQSSDSSVAVMDAKSKRDAKKPEEAKAEIADFGEKLGGARKDQMPSMDTSLSDDDIATQPLSKIWPANEIDAIEDPFIAAVAYAARAEVPAKPRVAYKVARWVERVKTVRNLAQRILDGSIAKDRFAMLMNTISGLDGFAAKVALLEAIDRKHWGRIGYVREYPDAYRYGESGEKIPSPNVYIRLDDKHKEFPGAKSVADIIEQMPEALGDGAQVKKMQFEVRGKKGSYSINKKGDKEYRILKTFADSKEAFAFIKDNYADLVAAWDGVKESDNVSKTDVRNEENRPRTGKDRRDGKDVTPEQFSDTFGFRGVEFGLWVKQGGNAKDRQGMLNQAFDAMHDLAEIVGIPPKAISLNGTLGLGFGSRGKGAASAHFEPGNLVINLTKTRGAGTLAHEWFHALDNYFARMRNNGNQKTMAEVGNVQEEYRRQNFVTYKPEPLYVHKTKQSTAITRAELARYHAQAPGSSYYDPTNWHKDPSHPEGVRTEVESAFAELVNSLNAAPMARRARLIDKSADGYWSRIIERGARSFENYIITKMMEGGYNNDYLANVRPIEDFPRSKDRYPYLLPDEVAPIAEAFDGLFSTLQTKETEQGVMLYNQASAGKISPADKAIYGMAAEGKSAAEILKLIVSASRNPFYRQVAKLLLKTGIAPTITIGDSKGWKFNAGEGNKYAAAYNPKTGTVSLFRPAAAERNMIHELIHAATLKALTKNGAHSQNMKALYAFVKRSGKLKGMYGMSDVDEFTAEAFSNPKFQEALKGIDVPKLGNSPTKNAWAWFIRNVRSILGLPVDSHDALSQALDIGLGVMRENMRIGQDASVSEHEKRRNLLNMPPISVDFDSSGSIQEAKHRAKVAYAKLQAATQKDGFAAITADGKQVKFSGAGFKEATHHAADRRVLAVLANAKQLIESAVPLYSSSPATHEQGVKAYHYYGVKAGFNGENEAFVLLEIKETSNGDWFYDADATDVETARAIYSAALADQTKSGAGDAEPMALKGRLAKWLAGVNEDGVRYNIIDDAKAKFDELTSPDAINTLIYNFQNKYNDLKNIQERIKAMNGQITDLNDAYLGEETYHSKAMKRGKDFLANELKPLLQQLHNNQIKKEDFEQFLHARHAPERNAEMAKRNPNQQMIDTGRTQADADVKALELQLQKANAQGLATKAIDTALTTARAEKAKWHGAQAFRGTEDERNSLSGMSDAAAAQIIATIQAGRRSTLDSAAAKVDAINAKTLDTQLAAGLIDKATFDAIKKTYQFYVPLHRDEAHPDQSSHSIGQGFSVKGAGIQRATGSNEKVTNILGHIALQREAQNTRAEKNSVAKRLYLLAAQNPLKDFWSIDKPPMIKTIDERTGFVRSSVDPTYKNKPNVVMVRIAGKDVAIVFNEQNPEAVRLAEALKNLDGQDLDVVERTLGRVTRWIASVNTQYNPIFGLINFARDVQGAMFNLTATELKDHKASTWKETFRLFKEITKSGFQLDKMNAADQALWNDFQNNGGATGYRDLFANPEERTKALEQEMKALDGGPVVKKFAATAQWLSDYNESMENVVRLAAYKVAVQNGMSKERAASLAKNLTVNFNRKGAKAQKLGAFYAFFNASIQGSTRLAQTLKGPAGRKIIAGGIALGVMQQMLGMMMMGGGDDDEWAKVPDFIKERSIVIPTSKDTYIAIPMPLGFNVIPNIGRLFAEWATGGVDKPTGAQLAKLAGVIVGGFNPLGGSDLVEAAFPTAVDPIIALLRNKDWTGKPIYREDKASLDPTPGFTRTKDSATPWAKGLAYAVNWASGGTDYQPGRFSWTPDQIDYVIGTVTGGAGRELGKLAQTLAAPFSAEELPTYKIPLIGRIVGSTSGVSGQSEKFYENIRTLNGFEREIKGRAEAGKDVTEFIDSEPRAELVGLANASETQVKNLRKSQRFLKKEGDNAGAKEIDGMIAEVMKGLNMEMRNAIR